MLFSELERSSDMSHRSLPASLERGGGVQPRSTVYSPAPLLSSLPQGVIRSRPALFLSHFVSPDYRAETYQGVAAARQPLSLRVTPSSSTSPTADGGFQCQEPEEAPNSGPDTQSVRVGARPPGSYDADSSRDEIR